MLGGWTQHADTEWMLSFSAERRARLNGSDGAVARGCAYLMQKCF